MSVHMLPGGKKVTVIHQMADGTIRDSLDGYVPDVKKMDPALKHLLYQWLCTDMTKQNESGL